MYMVHRCTCDAPKNTGCCLVAFIIWTSMCMAQAPCTSWSMYWTGMCTLVHIMVPTTCSPLTIDSGNLTFHDKAPRLVLSAAVHVVQPSVLPHAIRTRAHTYYIIYNAAVRLQGRCTTDVHGQQRHC
jgi:hypothetical protein